MPWHHLVWVLRPGDRVKSPDGTEYRVKHTTLLPLPNQPPLITLEKLEG